MEHPSNPQTDQNRRDFLKLTGATIAGLSLSGASFTQAEEDKKPRFKKAVKIGMVQIDGTLTDKFKLVKSLGYDGIEFASPNSYSVEEVLEARDASGLPIHGLVNTHHWGKPISSPDDRVFSEILKSLETSIRDAHAYGATSVLLVPGVVKKETSYGYAYKRVQEGIRKLLPLAKEKNIQILLENVWNNFLLSPVEMARFIDELESDMVGCYFDVGNVVRFGWPEHWITALGPRIKKLDIKEYSRELQNSKGPRAGFGVELGEGDCDWPTVVNALREINYTGWATAEVRGGDKARLQDIANRMDKILEMNS